MAAQRIIRWEEEEWLQFAVEVARLQPEVLTGPYVGRQEILEQAMARMPEGRRRTIPRQGGIGSYRNKLREIFNQLRPAPPPPQSTVAPTSPPPAAAAPPSTPPPIGQRIRWSQAENDALAQYMLAQRADFSAEDMTINELCAAMNQVLPPERRRNPGGLITGARVGIREALRRIRVRATTSVAFQWAPPPATTAPTTAPTAAPGPVHQINLAEVPPFLQQHPAPTPAPTAAAPDEGPPLRYDQLDHTAWEPHEWHQVAEELNRRFPEAQFRHDPHLNALTADMMLAAQRVLPPTRRRPGFFGLDRAKDKLWDEFSKMPGAATVTPAPSMAPRLKPGTKFPTPEEDAAITAAALDDPDAQPYTDDEWSQVKPVRGPVAPAEAFMPRAEDYPAPDPYRAAFEPLVKVFADALAASMRPVLRELIAELRTEPTTPAATRAQEQEIRRKVLGTVAEHTARANPDRLVAAVEQTLSRSQPAPAPRVTPAPTPAPPPPTPAPTKKPAEPARPLVGVVGAQPIQQRMLEASYPQLRFEFVDKHTKVKPMVNALRDCVRVIAMAQYMVKPTLTGLADEFGHRFAKVMGSGSAVKHQLDLWLHQGVLNEHYTHNGTE